MGVKIKKRGGRWYVFVNFRGHRKAKCVGVSKGLAEQVRRELEARLALGDCGFLTEGEKQGKTFAEYAEQCCSRKSGSSSTVTFLVRALLCVFRNIRQLAIAGQRVADQLRELAAVLRLERHLREIVHVEPASVEEGSHDLVRLEAQHQIMATSHSGPKIIMSFSPYFLLGGAMLLAQKTGGEQRVGLYISFRSIAVIGVTQRCDSSGFVTKYL